MKGMHHMDHSDELLRGMMSVESTKDGRIAFALKTELDSLDIEISTETAKLIGFALVKEAAKCDSEHGREMMAIVGVGLHRKQNLPVVQVEGISYCIAMESLDDMIQALTDIKRELDKRRKAPLN